MKSNIKLLRIEGVTLPRKRRIDIALTSIFGIGKFTSKTIVRDADVAPNVRCDALSKPEIARLRNAVSYFKTEGKLRLAYEQDIQRLVDNGSLRGRRSNLNLPRRGQRTRTNSRTARKGK
jgi:small subunit ribosomal protein S13